MPEWLLRILNASAAAANATPAAVSLQLINNQAKEEKARQERLIEREQSRKPVSAENAISNPVVELEYEVKSGDGLYRIAKKLNVDVNDLLKLNNLTLQSIIKPGLKLIYKGRQNPVTTTTTTGTYQVKEGDSLAKIAKNLGTSVEALARTNGISDPNKIRIGLSLNYTGTTTKVPEKKSVRIEDIEAYEKGLNEKYGTDYAGLINLFYADKPTGLYYLIHNKVGNRLGLYKDGQLVKEYKTASGASGKVTGSRYVNMTPGTEDDYTVTLAARDSNGNLIQGANGRYKLDDSAGNMATPAGVFYSTYSGDYHGAPAFMRRDRGMVARNSSDGIASSMHVWRANVPGDNSLTSNGCVRLSADDLKDLYGIVGSTPNIPTYSLPQNVDENKFFVRNGEINFSSSRKPIRVQDKRDATGQRSFESTTQLNGIFKGYKSPLTINFAGYNKNGEMYSDLLQKNVRGLIEGLQNNKESLINDLGINDDTYNQLAKYSLGIIGRESSYGKENGAIENAAKSLFKLFHIMDTSPDIYRKYTGYAGIQSAKGDKWRSIGLAQLKQGYMSDAERELWKKYGITEEDLVYNPLKSAIATVIHLAQAYKDKGLNMDAAIKSFNNKRKGYVESVKNLADEDFTFYTEYKRGGKLIARRR